MDNSNIAGILALQVAMNELALFIAKQAKAHHGLGIQDGIDLIDKVIGDADFRSKMEAAVKGVSQLGSEVKTVSLEEGLQLVASEIAFIPQLVAVLKG